MRAIVTLVMTRAWRGHIGLLLRLVLRRLRHLLVNFVRLVASLATRQGWHALEKLRAALVNLGSPWRLCRSMGRMSLPPDHVMTLPCSRQSVPGFLFRTLPYSRRLWTPASASRSARPSRRLPGTRTRGLRVFTPTSTAAWTLTRFGDPGDASMVSPNTTCSSLSRSTRSALQATVASCSAATMMVGPGSPSRGAYGASPRGVTTAIAVSLRGLWILVRETSRMTPSRSLLAAPWRLLRLQIRQR